MQLQPLFDSDEIYTIFNATKIFNNVSFSVSAHKLVCKKGFLTEGICLLPLFGLFGEIEAWCYLFCECRYVIKT